LKSQKNQVMKKNLNKQINIFSIVLQIPLMNYLKKWEKKEPNLDKLTIYMPHFIEPYDSNELIQILNLINDYYIIITYFK